MKNPCGLSCHVGESARFANPHWMRQPTLHIVSGAPRPQFKYVRTPEHRIPQDSSSARKIAETCSRLRKRVLWLYQGCRTLWIIESFPLELEVIVNK